MVLLTCWLLKVSFWLLKNAHFRSFEMVLQSVWAIKVHVAFFANQILRIKFWVRPRNVFRVGFMILKMSAIRANSAVTSSRSYVKTKQRIGRLLIFKLNVYLKMRYYIFFYRLLPYKRLYDLMFLKTFF